jgi:hypothetical protein
MRCAKITFIVDICARFANNILINIVMNMVINRVMNKLSTFLFITFLPSKVLPGNC